jgi:hypothetical protein
MTARTLAGRLSLCYAPSHYSHSLCPAIINIYGELFACACPCHREQLK